MNKITPFLWFDGNAEEAVNLYLSVFENSKVTNVNRSQDGAVFSMTFELSGQEFMALNGGPMYTFSPAVSFFVNCETQEEVDYLWERLSAGGEEQPCGWLKDRFGLSWQIIPSVLSELISDPDPEKSQRAVQAMLTMSKIDIEDLKRAHAGRVRW